MIKGIYSPLVLSMVSNKLSSNRRLLLKSGPRPWTLTLKNMDPENPGS